MFTNCALRFEFEKKDHDAVLFVFFTKPCDFQIRNDVCTTFTFLLHNFGR